MSDLTSYPCLARKGRHLYRIGACPHCEAKRLRSEVATLEASRQQIFKAADIEIEQLRAELAASREREARLRAIAESAIKTRSRDVSDWADDMRRIAALAEGAQG